MHWIVPVLILLYVLLLHVLLERSYAKWSLRIKEMERRNDEFVAELRRQREARKLT
jgi:hypothetical protein